MSNTNTSKKTTALIILAAGASRRMGQPKQLLLIKGEAMIKTVVRQGLRSECFPVIVVLGANYHMILPEVENMPVFIHWNEKWETGLSSSIRSGLDTLERVYPHADGAILAVADQPKVTSDVINELLTRHRSSPNKIIASRYGDAYGTPCLFPRIFFQEIRKSSGDKGARAVIDRNLGQVVFFDFEKGQIDLDTPQDYLELNQT